MKTKNIFRTLLVAVALLLGVDTVKAQANILLFESQDGVELQSGVTRNFELGKFATATAGDKLRVWGVPFDKPAEWNAGPTDHKIEIKDHLMNTVFTMTSGFDATKEYYDFVLDQEAINGFNSDAPEMSWYNSSGSITGEWFRLFKVEIVPGNSGETPIPPTPAKADVILAFSDSEPTAEAGKAFTAPTLTATADGQTVTGLTFTYSSSDTSVATVDDSGAVTIVAAGETTITASFAGNDSYNEASASYTLTVSQPVVVVETVPATIKAGMAYATFCSDRPLDFSGVKSLKAFIATEVADGEVKLQQVVGTVAARTGLVIKGESAEIPVATADGETFNGNLLEAVVDEDYSASGADVYVLTVIDGIVTFGQAFVYPALVPKGHAYLRLASGARLRSLAISDSETMGIAAVADTDNAKDGKVYNLAGQLVSRPASGLYIVNGKKLIRR